MIYVLIIGFIVIAIVGSFASSRNIRKTHEANLEALKKAQEDEEFSHKVSLRKASLFDEFRTSEKEPFKGMSDNQLLEFIELSIRQYNESKSNVIFIGVGIFVILVGAFFLGIWYFVSRGGIIPGGVFETGLVIIIVTSIFLTVKLNKSINNKYQQKGFALDQLKID